MDWYMDAQHPEAVPSLRHELMAYLRRHAAEGADLDAAEVAIGELLTNVVRHAPGPAWISLDWSSTEPIVTVHDLGPGFELGDLSRTPDLLQPHGRGLFIVSHLTQQLEVAAKGAGGARVAVVLPVPRRVERSYTSPVMSERTLPLPDEANDEGAFGKESFLRALVVELSQAVEMHHGPDAAEAAVSDVGTAVGGRMEEAYRAARGIIGDLSSEQIADLYVRLKGAIDGDFYVVDISDDRIVLGNRRCPFGDVVKRSPALCRMTSSVFGGIAARSRGESAVQLEERIAVGDPECRVVVWLREPPADARAGAHFYSNVPATA